MCLVFSFETVTGLLSLLYPFANVRLMTMFYQQTFSRSTLKYLISSSKIQPASKSPLLNPAPISADTLTKTSFEISYFVTIWCHHKHRQYFLIQISLSKFHPPWYCGIVSPQTGTIFLSPVKVSPTMVVAALTP